MSRKNARSGASLALVTLLCCAAQAVRAGETTQVTADLTVENDYDSNVTYSENNPRGSAITIVRPELKIENQGTLGHANLDAWLSDHTFWDQSELDGTDRGVGGDIDRAILPRLSIFGSGSYQRIAPHSEIRGPENVTIVSPPGLPSEPVITPGQLIEGAVPTADVGQGQLGARYLLTPLSKLSVSGGPYSIDYVGSGSTSSGLRDREGYFADLTLDHSLSATDALSFSVDASSTNFSDVPIGTAPIQDPLNPHEQQISSGSTQSDLLSFSMGWNRTWNELWTTSVSIGGRRLESQTIGASEALTRVAPNPFTGQVTSFTDFVKTDTDAVGPGWIGGLSIQRLLPRGLVAASYTRETRSTSSLAASNVDVDVLSLIYKWRLAEYVTFTATGGYEHYESADKFPQFEPATYIPGSFNPITGPVYSCPAGMLVESGSGFGKTGQCQINTNSRLSSELWTATARLDWQLRKRLSTFVVLRWVNRSGDPQLFGNPYDKWNVGLGFTYAFALDF